ncbi:MAG: hypothetical protein COV44_01440 [Deltaproteobacteria bacterium CG11_big_fil_rev_8_21_14_0_20_45_16]|nr:MAG: hypothetical protein COV44_01440 [Deltaproteobacteria bacterium CG11_big_fil_rev_8_21_14_0_20_45_16]
MKVGISKYNINGFDAFLIDTHQGNAIAVCFNVQVGAWHDCAGESDGRAHLWEHVIHLGSRDFPGAGSFDQVCDQMGADYNAFTSNSRTFYHLVVHPEFVDKAIHLMGSTISHPAWDQKSFERERKVVMNEALEYQATNSIALEAFLMKHLFEENHPLRFYDIGTQTSLQRLDRESLLRFYSRNYQPSSAQIIIAGNLKEQGLEGRIVEELKKHFHPPAHKGEASDIHRRIPRAFGRSGSHPLGVELVSKDGQQMMQMNFELKEGEFEKHREAFDLFIDFLNCDHHGSLEDQLIEKDWILAFSCNRLSVNNLHFLELNFELTERGARARKKIIQYAIGYLQQLKREPISKDMIEYLKTSFLAAQLECLEDPRVAAEFFGEELPFNPEPLRLFEDDSWSRELNAPQILTALQDCLDLDSWRYAYCGPEVTSKLVDADFERAYTLIPAKAFGVPTRIRKKFEEPSVSRRTFAFKTTPDKGTRSTTHLIKSKLKCDLLLMREEHILPSLGLILKLNFPVMSAEEILGMRLRVAAFEQRHKTELSTFEGLGLFDMLKEGSGALYLLMKGNSSASLECLMEILHLFVTFKIKRDELDFAREQEWLQLLENKQSFTARQAISHGLQLLDGQDLVDDLVEKLLEKRRIQTSFPQRTDLIISAMGDLSRKKLIDLHRSLRKVMPRPLLRSDRLRKKDCYRSVSSMPKQILRRLDNHMADEALGLSRIWDGPRPRHADFVWTLLLVNFMAAEIFRVNRTEQELGYIQSGDLNIHGDRSLIYIYGQTQGPSLRQKMIDGWERVIQSLEDSSMDLEKLEEFRRGLVRARQIEAFGLGSQAAQALAYLESTGDPRFGEKLTHRLDQLKLDPKAINAWVKKYLRKAFMEVQVSGGPQS